MSGAGETAKEVLLRVMLAHVVAGCARSPGGGLWLLLAAVPLVGIIVLVVIGLAEPDPAGVRYDRPVVARS